MATKTRMRMQLFIRQGLFTLAALLISSAPGYAEAQIQVPMDASHWHRLEADSMGSKGNPEFTREEGFPQGLMTLKEGSAGRDGLTFKDGTIEYDFKAIGEGAPGIQFRINGSGASENSEEFYFRTGQDCRASDDCVQYTPVIHGFMLWDVYPQYQHQAMLLDGWNHVRLVVSGRRMQVYVNGLPQPALSVGNLESDSKIGSIHLRGSAQYANLVVTPGLVDGLPPQPTPDVTADDRAIVRRWELSELCPISSLAAPVYAEMPKAASAWQTIHAERGGLVNLNRQYTMGDQPAAVSWLRYTVNAKQPGVSKFLLAGSEKLGST